MAEEYLPKFDNLKPKAKSLVLANCHLKMGAFRWLCKGCCARDYQKYARETPEDKLSYENNLDQMVQAFKEEHPLKIKVSKTPLANTGNTIKDVFKHPEATALIMFCPLDLLEDLIAIFQALDCGLPIGNHYIIFSAKIHTHQTSQIICPTTHHWSVFFTL